MAILACGLLTFSACSNDDAFNEDETNVTAGETRNVELTFNFSVNSGEQTRGGRPLYSSEALQQVNAMKVYVFKASGDDYLYSEEINGNNFGFNNITAQGTESHSYTLTDKLADGTYKFLAVGYEEGYGDTFKELTMQNTTKLSDLLLELKEGKNADEVFSGVSEDVTVNATSTSFNVGVKLNRVVAGILGYFKNVPYQIEKDGKLVQVKHVLVNVIKKGTSAKLAERTANGVGSKYTIIDIDMSTYSNSKDGNNNWYSVPAKSGAVATVANSVLQGAYSLPIAALTDNNTLEVVLTGADKGTVLKTFKVKDDNSYDFAINANHFYSLGQKMTNDDTNGGDPDPDPDPDDNDKPIDLSKDQIITITVNANWDAIHDLTVE